MKSFIMITFLTISPIPTWVFGDTLHWADTDILSGHIQLGLGLHDEVGKDTDCSPVQICQLIHFMDFTFNLRERCSAADTSRSNPR